MFRGLENLFEKKKSNLARLGSKNLDIKNILDAFFEGKFNQKGENLYSRIHYSLKDQSLTIQVKNKIIANELAIQLGNLSDLFKKDKITVKQIIIV